MARNYAKSDSILNTVIADNTPMQGNICATKRCGGIVVKKPTCVGKDKFRYQDSAECLLCDRVYLFATNVQKITITEAKERPLKKK